MLGTAGSPFTAKFLVRRLSANFTTLMRSGSAPGVERAAWRTAFRSALQGASGWAAAPPQSARPTNAMTNKDSFIARSFISLPASISPDWTSTEGRAMGQNDCVFCKIIAREERGHFICEDELASAILTIGPVTPGHLMVI